MTEITIMNLKPFQGGWSTKVTIVRESVVQQLKIEKENLYKKTD